MSKKKSTIAKVATGGLAVSTAIAGTAPVSSWWWPDDRSHPVQLVASGTSFASQANLGTSAGVSAIVGDTDWTSTQLNTPGSVIGAYDVVTVVDTRSAPTNAGGVICSSGDTAANRCDQFSLRYYPYYVGSTTRSDDNFWRALGCHEMTHTVGVAERTNNDCVNAPWAISNRSLYAARHPTYSVDELNNVYKNTV